MKIVKFLSMLAFLGLSLAANAQLLRLNVQKGQTFMHDINLTATLDVKAKSGNMKFEVPIAVSLKYYVVSNNADTTIVSAAFTDLKFDFDILGKKFGFDSKKDSAENGETAVLMNFLNKPVEIHYDNRRKITNVVFTDLKNEFKSLIEKEKKEKQNALDILLLEDEEVEMAESLVLEVEEVETVQDVEDKDILAALFPDKSEEEREKLLQKILEKYYEAFSLIIFPEQAVKQGMKWERSFTMEGIEGMKGVDMATLNKMLKNIKPIPYVVTKTSETKTTITSIANNKIDLKKLGLGKLTKGIKIKKSIASSQIVIDNRTGWLDSFNAAYILSAAVNQKGKKSIITFTLKYDIAVQ